MANRKKFKMFDAAKLKFNDLRLAITDYIKSVYDANDAELTAASPMMQVLYVLANLGRMILFYIESAMNETNILTAVHDRSVKGIAQLTGHNASRGMASRGGVTLIYNRSTEYDGRTINIPNYTKIKNKLNGLIYMIMLPGDNIQYTVGNSAENIEVSIIQGELQYQQATGTGNGMQSFSFASKNLEIVDDFYVNVYVNSERWVAAKSFIDLSYDEHACIIKTGANGGIDVFFGNGVNGAVPEYGATITVEYLICNGDNGNISLNFGIDDTQWLFEGGGVLEDGSFIDLNSVFSIVTSSDIMFGNQPESISLTRLIAPYASRSFVMANKINYEYFLRKLNMFSTIDVNQGFNSYEDKESQINYDIAETNYINARESYLAQLKLTGEKSVKTKEKYKLYIEADNNLTKAKNVLENSKMDDNIIYLFLVPKLENRISETNNYFTCSQDAFVLSKTEKNSIIELIDNSGQKLITVDNEIIDPKMPRFAINIFLQMWNDHSFETVKTSMISVVSTYLLNNTRRDRIPVSDIIKILEEVDGVDSVSVYFDADINNESIYGKGEYGIDEYGDIIMERGVKDTLGNLIKLKDIFPLFRGPFTSKYGVEYSDDLKALNSAINVTLRGKTDAQMSDKIKVLK